MMGFQVSQLSDERPSFVRLAKGDNVRLRAGKRRASFSSLKEKLDIDRYFLIQNGLQPPRD
jgi:hypothetical protein